MADASKRYVVVELLGPAGAGKSTLMAMLAERSPVIAAGVPIAASTKAKSLVRLGSVLAPLLPRALQDQTWFTREHIRCMAYLEGWQLALREGARDDRTVIMDHGPIYRLALLREFGPPAARSRQFERWWQERLEAWAAALDLVVQLDAPHEVLHSRIRQRRRGHPLERASEERGRQVLDRYRSAFGVVLDQIVAVGGTRVVQFDTAASEPDAVVESLANMLVVENPR